jgi:hypothetical protein
MRRVWLGGVPKLVALCVVLLYFPAKVLNMNRQMNIFARIQFYTTLSGIASDPTKLELGEDPVELLLRQTSSD